MGSDLAAQDVQNNSCTAKDAIVKIDDKIVEHNFMPYQLQYFCDTTNTLQFKEMASEKFAHRFRNHPEYQNKDFKVNASYWIKLPIRHTRSTEKVWLLEFYDQTIDNIEAFIPRLDGSYERVIMGDENPFEDRIIPIKILRSLWR